MDDTSEDRPGWVHVSEAVRDVVKEITRRAELRQRLEAERGGPMSDEEFLAIAERTGIPL